MKLKPVHIDGALWVLLALFTTQQQMLTGEEAYKYASPYFLFWFKFTVASLAAATASLKAFRSTSYTKHLVEEGATKQ